MAGAEPGFAPIQLMPAPSGIASSSIGYSTVSCPSASWCAAAGSSQTRPFVSTQISGVWGTPQVIALPSGGVSGRLYLTCPSVGDCVAAGTYTTTTGETLPMMATESSGTWSAATSFALPSGAITSGNYAWTLIEDPWCQSVGNCTVFGTYTTAPYGYELFSMTETSGTWGDATALPGGEVHPYLASFGCSSIGNCSAVTQVAAWTEIDGVWGDPTAPAAAPADEYFEPGGIACPSATTCIVVGYVDGDNGVPSQPVAATATETNGAWGTVAGLPMPQFSPPLLSTEFWRIACQAGVCVAVGDGGSFNRNDAYQSPIAATWSDGSWSSIGLEQLALPRAEDRDGSFLDDVSCATATQCVAVGDYGIYGQNKIISNSLSPFSTTLTPVRPMVPPAPPIDVAARPQLSGAVVRWAPPVDDGGNPITHYLARLSPGGETCMTTAHACRFTDLTNGRQYVVVLTDTNGTYASRRVLSNHFFAGERPSAPMNLRVDVSDHSVQVSWSRSVTPAGEPVLRYAVHTARDHRIATCVTRGTACTIYNLARGSYAFSVFAQDVTGWSRAAVVEVAVR